MTMYAYLSTQGTAMANTAICGRCLDADPEVKSRIEEIAECEGDWNGEPLLVDCSGNDALDCMVCLLAADYLEQLDGDALLNIVYELRDTINEMRVDMRAWWGMLTNMTSADFQQGFDRPIRQAIQARLGIDEYGQPVKEK